MVIIVLVVFGLCSGSFVNALVWRLHKQSKKTKTKKELSILRGRSMCPNCRHELAAADLVPVFSWLWLRGKCRYCHKPISVQYPFIEALTALLFVISYWFWPGTAHGTVWSNQQIVLFGFWLVFLTGFIALAVYDIKWQLLPNKIIIPLIYLAILQAAVLIAYSPKPQQILGIGLSFLIGGGIFYVIFQISAGKWIGGGDVKLGALLGLVLASPSLMLMTIFSASLLGTAFSLPLMLNGRFKRTTRIPFGPFLIAGAFIARLFGAALITWYKHKYLYY